MHGLDSGRFIVIEFNVGFDGGIRTLEGSNSTNQVYSIMANNYLVLSDGKQLDKMIFTQTRTHNPIIDLFEVGPLLPDAALSHARYLHTDENGEVVLGLPLFIYTHGGGRGGTIAGDLFSSLKSANGAMGLMKRILKSPEIFASHILVPRGTPDIQALRTNIEYLIAQGLVDPNRIYMSGFSAGGRFVNNFINANPGFVAAASPVGMGSSFPTPQNVAGNENIAFWSFANRFDSPHVSVNAERFAEETMPLMSNARVTLFSDVNDPFVWPFSQNAATTRPEGFTMSQSAAHEVEAAVFFNRFVEPRFNWNILPTFQSPGLEFSGQYTDIFDWMFAQKIEVGDPIEPDPTEPKPTEPKPEITQRYQVESFMERLYTIALGRKSDSEGLKHFSDRLLSRRYTAAQVISYILLESPEFIRRSYTDREFITIAYRILLNRMPDPAGEEFWLGKLRDGYSRRWIIANMISAPTTEFQRICERTGIVAGRLRIRPVDVPQRTKQP